MKDWMRISLVSFALIGGTAFFVNYSFNEFNNALDGLHASFLEVVSMSQIPSSHKISKEQISTSTSEVVPTVATSTGTDASPSFVFPEINDGVYVGCTYRLSFQPSIQSSSTTQVVETVLVDAGAREIIDPSTSGLARENEMEPDSPIVDWNVGKVWPGKYYIRLSGIEGVDPERSNVFTIRSAPTDMNVDENGECLQRQD